MVLPGVAQLRPIVQPPAALEKALQRLGRKHPHRQAAAQLAAGGFGGTDGCEPLHFGRCGARQGLEAARQLSQGPDSHHFNDDY